MMKKFLALMLTMAMSFCLVACGGDEPAVEEQQQQPAQQEQQQQEPAQQEQQAAQEGETAAEPLWNYANVQVPSNIVGTTWNLSGGCFGGVELTQEEYEAALEQYGGQCAFYFGEDGVAKMLQGGGELVGTWEYADEDGYVLGVVFEYSGQELRYACVFTDMSTNTPVMMIAISDAEGQEGLYFDMDEH